MISEGVVTVSYIAAMVLFILALGGLSDQETARRGNWYGVIGMFIALVATILGVVNSHYDILPLSFRAVSQSPAATDTPRAIVSPWKIQTRSRSDSAISSTSLAYADA